mgnify:CR=1 FL=1
MDRLDRRARQLELPGGLEADAAVVARGMGMCAVVGADDLVVDVANKQIRVGDRVINEGDVIAIDGKTGEVFLGDKLESDPSFAGLVRVDRHLGGPDQAANANLIAETGETPAVNQVELHPYLQQKELREFHDEHGGPDGKPSLRYELADGQRLQQILVAIFFITSAMKAS